MHSRCAACIVKSSDGQPHDRQRAGEALTVLRIVEPSRGAAGMRQRDEHALTVHSTLSDDFAQRDLPPEPFDRERADEEKHPRSNECELRIDPRCAQLHFGRRRTSITCTARGFPGKAFCDRGAIRQMRLIDARHREPPAELGAGASGERQASRELNGTWRLADDHHAIAHLAGDDRKCGRKMTGVDAFGARADARMKTNECPLSLIRRSATAVAHVHPTRL